MGWGWIPGLGLALCAAMPVVLQPSSADAAPATPPNVVVIVTDDQAASWYGRETMPATSRLLGDRGITFDDAIVNDPQCCPSRASFYTGQYPHNNGVTSNDFALLQRPNDILPAWLDGSGYRSFHVGKYMNRYYDEEGLEPSPAWDRWLTLLTGRYDRPLYSLDGVGRRFNQYLTTLQNQFAVNLINRYGPRRRPFYLHLDQFAPHEGSGATGDRCDNHSAVPAPADAALYEGIEVPEPLNYDEPEVSDKPAFIQRLPRISEAVHDVISERYGCALASLREVDRGVAQIVRTLRKTGELRRTAIIFTSDNGYSFGEHRYAAGKGVPYEENLRVPLVIRPPTSVRSFEPGSSTDELVANVDLAPTILALAGADSCRARGRCRTMDGRSLLPLIRGRRPDWTRERGIPISFDIAGPRYGLGCVWNGVRTSRRTLVHTSVVPDSGNNCVPGDELELYDLDRDPFQLENLHREGEPPSMAELEMARKLSKLRNCAGIRGRDRRTGGRPFCD